MDDYKPLLEPKQSTIDKILLYSKSINAIKSTILNCNIITNLN